MKIGQTILLLSGAIFVVLLFVLLSQTLSREPLGLQSKVIARVGEFSLNLSGFASPFASIVLTSDGVFYRSTVADENGNFSFTDVLIRKGFDSFCLLHIDFKRIGESEVCFAIPPATAAVTKRDIFLPPTIGLQRSEIEAGSDAVIFGYTMPGADVTIHLKNGKAFVVRADATGFYQYTLTNVAAGIYELYATANYEGRQSEAPSRTVKLVALTWWQQLVNLIQRIWQQFVDLLTGLGLGPLWLLIPLLPIITYFVLKIWPERFTVIYDSRLYAFFKHKDRKLHHAWMVGY